MRKVLGFLGLIAILEGLTGVINQLVGGAPNIVLRLFDHFNRLVAEGVPFLDGFELLANAALGILGAVLAVLARRASPGPAGRGRWRVTRGWTG